MCNPNFGLIIVNSVFRSVKSSKYNDVYRDILIMKLKSECLFYPQIQGFLLKIQFSLTNPMNMSFFLKSYGFIIFKPLKMFQIYDFVLLKYIFHNKYNSNN